MALKVQNQFAKFKNIPYVVQLFYGTKDYPRMAPINVPISQYKPAIFNTPKKKRQSQSERHSKDIKSHLNLLSLLYRSYTSTQIRKGELTAFLAAIH